MKPKIFIGSSVEGLNVAYAIQQNLTHNAESTVWDQGVFELSKTTIESLNAIVNSVDFAILVFSPDDEIVMRGEATSVVRDNVLFELGLFIGKLGRERVFFVVPEGSDMRIPTDLVGVTPGHYDPKREDKSYQAATGAVCNQIRNQIKAVGPLIGAAAESDPDESSDKEETESIEWLHDFIDKDYVSAKEKLEKELATKSGADLIRDTAWLKFIQFKLNEKDGLHELCDYAKSSEVGIYEQKMVLRFLIWENCEEKAIELIDEIMADNPSSIELIAIKAECYSINGEEEKAIDLLMSSNPDQNPSIAIELAVIYEKQDDLDSALKVLNKAYISFPNNELLMYKYSRFLDDTGRHKEALFLLNALTISDPKSVAYWGYLSNNCLQLDLYDKAMAACKRAEEVSEGKEAWILHNVGNMLNNKGFYSDAIDWLNKGLSIEKDSQYAHDRLSSALKNKEKENEKFNGYCKEGRKLIRTAYTEETEQA